MRIEMLAAVTTMLQEGVVHSLSHVMQAKLVSDLMDRVRDDARSPLVRGYCMLAAHAAVVAFNALRPLLLRSADASAPSAPQAQGGTEESPPSAALFVRSACSVLRMATKAAQAAVGDGSGAASSANGDVTPGDLTNPFSVDPFERLRLLSTACQALYLVAAGSEAALPLPFGPDGRRLSDAQRLPDVSQLATLGVAPLLVRAVEAAAAALRDRCMALESGAAAAPSAAENGGEGVDKEGGAAASELDKAAAGELPYDDNWREFLDMGFKGALVPREAASVVGFGGALLQLVARSTAGAGSSECAWPSEGVLKGLAEACNCAGSGSDEEQLQLVSQVAKALQSGLGEEAKAVVGLPAFATLAAAAFSRRCCHCAKQEDAVAPLKRCGACARAFYCGEKCQKAAWSTGHKQICKLMAAAGKAPSP